MPSTSNFIRATAVEELQATCTEQITRFGMSPNAKAPKDDLALIVDGKALLHLDGKELTPNQQKLFMDFLTLAQNCKAVIACRVSPDQKRFVVSMISNNTRPKPLTLAIGDGANDVPMILEASVGIGISGKEGMQAVRSSDYSIAQVLHSTVLSLLHSTGALL